MRRAPILAALALSCVSNTPSLRGDAEVDPALLQRVVDELGGPEAHLQWWGHAELDGEAPPELVVRALVPGGEGSWEQRTGAYRLRRGDAEPLAPPLIHGGYMDLTHLRVVDLDRDGRDELLVVGQTTGDAESELYVYSWGGVDGALQDLAWDAGQGVEYVPWDVTADGREEIVALGLDEQGSTRVTVMALEDGRYRRMREPPDPAFYLSALAVEQLGAAEVARPSHLIPRLLDALDRHAVTLARSPALTRDVRRRALAGAEPSEAWLTALAVVDPEALLALAREDSEAELPLAPAAARLLRDPEHADALLQIFEAALRAGHSTAFVVRGTLSASHALGDARASRLLAAVVTDDSVRRAHRARLLADLGWQAPEIAPTVAALLAGPDATMRRAAAEVLRRTHTPYAHAFAQAVSSTQLRAIIVGDDPVARRDVLLSLGGRADADSTALLLTALESPADRPDVLRILAAHRHCDEHADRFVALLGAVPAESHSLHRLIACAIDPRTSTQGIAAAESRGELRLYLERLGAIRERHGPPGARDVLPALRAYLAPAESTGPPVAWPASDAWVRADVVRALPALALDEAYAIVRDTFASSEDPAVRGAAAEALGRVPGGDVLLARWLRAHRNRDDDATRWIRSEALRGLSRSRTPTAREVLVEELPAHTLEAARSLAAHADPPSGAALAAELERVRARPEPDCRALGALIVARLDHRYASRSTGPAPQLLDDLRFASARCPSPRWARDALHRIGAERDRAFDDWLVALRQAHPEREIRARADAILRREEARGPRGASP